MLSWCVAFLPDLRNNLFIVEREQPSSRESFDSMGRFQCVPKFCSQRRKDLLNDVPTPRTSVPICNYLLIVGLHWLKHPNIQRLEGMAGVGRQAYNRYVVFSGFHDSGVCDMAVVSIIA